MLQVLCNNEKKRYVIAINLSILDNYNRKKKNRSYAEQNKMFNFMSILLEKTLNEGDIYSYWNDSQILVLFNEAKDGELAKAKKRIKEDFQRDIKFDKQLITVDFKPLSAPPRSSDSSFRLSI